MKHLRYLRTVLRHKWFVLIAGRRTGVPIWRLLVHDLSKFSRAEWGPYVRRFEGGRAGAMDHEGDADEWLVAWNHHWHRNPHHWEHWLRISNDGTTTTAMKMPETYVREMVADWMGAGRAYTGTWDAREWYAKNRARIHLHDSSRLLAELLLSVVTAPPREVRVELTADTSDFAQTMRRIQRRALRTNAQIRGPGGIT